MRKPRVFGETGIYHIIMRGNDQQNIFYDDDDRNFFISRLQKYVLKLNIDLYAYCLMGNHVHLLIGKGNFSMPDFVKRIACSYVYYFNHKYERTGHLFQGRYKSEPVETAEYFKTVYRYILQNPQKAGICHWEKYKWSSVQSLMRKNDFVNESFAEKFFENRLKMIDFLRTENDDECMEFYHKKFTLKDDDEIKTKFIRQLFGIENVMKLAKLPEEEKKETLRLLKSMEISINQIARITGIPRKIIKDA